MRQLNNINNHEIIKIDLIDILQNIIIYTCFEKENGIKLYKKSFIPEINLRSKQSELINFEELSYNLLKEKLTDFEVTTIDFKNWKLATQIRVIFPLKLVNDSLLEKDELSQIIQGSINANAVAETKFIFKSKNIVVAYFAHIQPEHQTVLDLYTNIIIEEA